MTQEIGEPQKIFGITIGGNKKAKKAPSSKKLGIDTQGYPKADLMPSSERKRQEKTWATRRWVFIFVLVAIGCVAAFFGSMAWSMMNEANYESDRTEEEIVLNQIDEYSDISAALNERDRLSSLRMDASGSSIDWERLIREIQSGLPGGSSISSFSVVNGTGQSEEGGSSDGTVASISALIVSGEPLDYADIVHLTPSTTSVELGNFTRNPVGDGGNVTYTYNVAFGFGEDLLSNAYSQAEDTGGIDDPGAMPGEPGVDPEIANPDMDGTQGEMPGESMDEEGMMEGVEEGEF